MTDTSTLRILEPARGVFAYYDGRVPGARLHSAMENWLDDGAYSLGIASYAIVEGSEAIVFDSHISLDHARAVRQHLEGRGVSRFTLVLSHWHDDHVAGNAVFADGPIIAHRLTRDALAANRDKLEDDKSLSFMQTAVADSTGWVTVTQKSCSDYVFLSKDLLNAVTTPAPSPSASAASVTPTPLISADVPPVGGLSTEGWFIAAIVLVAIILIVGGIWLYTKNRDEY